MSTVGNFVVDAPVAFRADNEDVVAVIGSALTDGDQVVRFEPFSTCLNKVAVAAA
jgi:uncharacterized NAD(P)/FAD-binding protein YdhS